MLLTVCWLAGCGGSPTATPTTAPIIAPSPTSPPVPTIREITATPAPRIAPKKTATTPPTFTPTIMPAVVPTEPPTATPIMPAVMPTEPPTDPVIAGAGDIAMCETTGDEATANLLDKIGGTIFTLGDNAYTDGSLEQFEKCYGESWGRFKERTHPIPGNHEYNTPGAPAYFAYFGASAGEPDKGYYSYDVGTWHVIALNSEIDTGENSPQVEWLRADLQAHPALCTVAMLHRPLFSSGPHGNDGSGDKTRPLWDVLYENNVDLVLTGHDHSYERFAPQNPAGEPDEARGIREFVVGTGGGVPSPFTGIKPNSEKRIVGPFGVLKLTLHPAGYDWDFVSIAPLLFQDRGQGQCH